MTVDGSSWLSPWREDHELLAVLEESRRLGFLGPRDVTAHLEHAVAMGRAVQSDLRSGAVLDLGSGGGVPGLVLARLAPGSVWTLLDSQERRTEFLTEAVHELGLAGRVVVVRARAEDVGRRVEHRERYRLVTSRSFGAAGITAECGSPLLAVGGRLVVSEPPSTDENRWPAAPLLELGLECRRVDVDGLGFAVLEKVAPTPEWAPRRVGRLGKRPYF
ncbi:MAG: rRNA (guanine527-N7)-methyltransferase [Acidimicrobiia bacterium]|nr:rRNA (guanine527-N7)-methyltransferase [Acidimicrobiia bacterium]